MGFRLLGLHCFLYFLLLRFSLSNLSFCHLSKPAWPGSNSHQSSVEHFHFLDQF